ncbi:MAG: N(5)-(carboxyethyl)ornithine synthase [Propionicimonas sp.]|uniref:N(5)-(carboxyethyl)ornithine synthase n=1 Tax=Propionicimonas sp. TaxID=1955623 RepID=UPI002B1EDAB1|nr:N(5)-(carboxyethyl)ornithine synthase [Propionicimonas sp.]MEA4944511.1 N(5)-(carboxyethyl)ornithine synthase [Propionicimonas sp.]
MSMQTESGPTLAVMGRSRKENERRLALHPKHLERIPDELRSQVFLETGYASRFGVPDAELAPWVGGFGSHDELVERCDIVLQPKPVAAELASMRPHQVFWGWAHCVQDHELTQLAIDNGLTVVAFEAMNHWHSDGSFSLHVFHKNNELAGYSSVLHALELCGLTGHYGRRKNAVVIGFGATARGAVTALNGLGFHDVDVLTHREVAAVAAPIHSVRMVHFENGVGATDPGQAVVEDELVPLPSFLAAHDIIVNCVLQDPNAPMVFLDEGHLPMLVPGTLVIDVSCDAEMGFSWARPTTFDEPLLTIGGVRYYAVDHSPSHLWAAATWENSEALLPFLPVVLRGPAAWDAHPAIGRAVEIRDGVVQNPAILTFQHRRAGFPHEVIAD